MLADFYIPRLSNDMKITVQKNHLEGQILYWSTEVWSLLKNGVKGDVFQLPDLQFFRLRLPVFFINL